MGCICIRCCCILTHTLYVNIYFSFVCVYIWKSKSQISEEQGREGKGADRGREWGRGVVGKKGCKHKENQKLFLLLHTVLLLFYVRELGRELYVCICSVMFGWILIGCLESWSLWCCCVRLSAEFSRTACQPQK